VNGSVNFVGPADVGSEERSWTQWVVAGILIATVMFNAGLAFINGHLHPLTGSYVTATQGLIVASALALVAFQANKAVVRWAILLWIMTLLFLVLSLLRDRIEPRYLGDVAVVFVFVMLGMGTKGRTIASTILVLQVMLSAVALWELASPTSYGRVFRIAQYYISTRGYDAASFWSKNGDLFVSAQRPGGRILLASLGDYRGSSLFLEPVSLGNWTVVVVIAVAALWRFFSKLEIAGLVLGNLILLVACDGRLSIALNLLLVPVLIVAPRLPRWMPTLILPAVFCAVLLAEQLGVLGMQGDNLVGRLHYGVDYLLRLDALSLIGLSDAQGVVAADSGWAYLIITQSLPGLILLWLALTLPSGPDSPGARRAVWGLALFLAGALPVSYSVLSIKTAGLLWAVYGCAMMSGAHGFQTRNDRRSAPAAAWLPLPAR
jgi:putative polymerase